jgi:hypothetical protein
MRRRGTRIGYWWENQRERDRLEDEDGDEWIILRCILEREDGVLWTVLAWLRFGDKWRALVFRIP